MRRMLLTSAGIRNDSLRSALADLIGKPFADASVAFIPTASVAVAGDHGWFVEDLSRPRGLGWRKLDILELNGLPAPMVLARLRHADVIYAEGGNHSHLANSIIVSGLAVEHEDLRILGGTRPRSPFGLFDWYLKPRLNSPDFPDRTPAWFEEAASKLDFAVYALDDDSAVRVRGSQTDVASDGAWRLFNSPAP